MPRARSGVRLPAHQATTRNLGAAYPMLAEPGLGHRGVLVGRDLLGGSFVHDPFVLYEAGVISNPNLVVIGQIGRGKSAFVKTYLWRQAVFGRRAWVVDPKGEYDALAAAWGVRPVALRPGGAVRLNPLDPGPDPAVGPQGVAGEPLRRQIELLGSLAVACLGRELAPRERVAIDLAMASVATGGRPATLPAVVDALLDPSDEAARGIRTDRATLLEDGRDVALEVRRLVHGDLQGMFDGPTTPGLDLSGPLVVLDLSALYNSAALGVLMACATAWLQATLARQTAPGASGADTGAGSCRYLVVVDEAWAILAKLSMRQTDVSLPTSGRKGGSPCFAGRRRGRSMTLETVPAVTHGLFGSPGAGPSRRGALAPGRSSFLGRWPLAPADGTGPGSDCAGRPCP